MLDWKYRPKQEQETEAVQAGPAAGESEPKPEGFASRNVKIITFIICITVLLVLFGPFSIIRLYLERQTDRDVAGLPMTVEDAIRLSDSRGLLTMRELQKYAGTVSENRYRINYYVEFDHYFILGAEDKQTGKLVTFTISDRDSDATADLLTEDARAFFERTRGEKG